MEQRWWHVNAKTASHEMFVLAYSNRAAYVGNSGRKSEKENEGREESNRERNKEKQYAYASLRVARHTEATGIVKLTRMLLAATASPPFTRSLSLFLPSYLNHFLCLSFLFSYSLYAWICIYCRTLSYHRSMSVTIAFLECDAFDALN